MVFWRCFAASSLITGLVYGCGNGAYLSTENTKQVVQEINVSQLLTEAKANQQAKDLFNRGNNLLDGQRYQDAIAAYDKAIAFKPESADAWINRGIALTKLQKHTEALVSYDKAIAIKSNKDEAWYNRGNTLVSLQRYKEAIASYDKAIAIKPNKHEAWINRGIALTKLQRYSEALASYDKAIAIKPDKPEAYYNRACTYALQGKAELAIKNLKAATKLVPGKFQQLAKTDPDFKKLRSDQRFKELIQ
jgi:tetratricopeptide (TPR) repeat protein